MCDKPLSQFALYALLAIAWVGNAEAKTCRITSGVVSFGAYNPASPGSLDTTGSLVLYCNGRFHAVLSLSIGSGSGASYAGGRKMTRIGGQGTLNYNLYTNAARTHIFGDGTGGSVTLPISGRNTYTQAIWGAIPGGQPTVSAGSYADTVVVTISY